MISDEQKKGTSEAQQRRDLPRGKETVGSFDVVCEGQSWMKLGECSCLLLDLDASKRVRHV